ncbi:flagellar motor protein MotD [Chitiniphilus shinanonensis]|uniref:Flagellar motor protein MotD n=1 Tax=Chitiniphilus shinanonensis TaxID=553088 RepID=A0ABQ6BXC8_9NEIS|nr:flagellar motor protein MotD [Chitiniphilus shinanonensis]GLS05810.1 flagellar motor protein MotD [Chitiniphilus shinanonensis]
MARRKRPEEHENHERWLVSYADFITLLFAFFVVMYAISSVNEGKYRVLSDSLITAFRNDPAAQVATIRVDQAQGQPKRIVQPLKSQTGSPTPSPALEEETRRMRGMAGSLRTTLGPLINQGKVRVTQSKRGIAVEIADSVLFQTAKADLQPQSVAALTAVARLVSQTDNLIQVEGHTDNQPINSLQYPSNWELSAARAASVVRLFADENVAPQRMVAIGYGEYRPVESNDSDAGRARNRRVTLNILADNRDDVSVLPPDPHHQAASAP